MKSGKLFFDCCEPSVGNQSTIQMKIAERMRPSTVPRATNCAMRFIGALPGPAARRGSYTHERLAVQASPAVGRENLVRFATVPPMRPSPTTALASIRTKFALPCAFAVITLCTLATAPVARSAEPAVARAVFVTPAGDRAEAQRAVVSAGGIPEGWVGGRLKAALQSAELAAVRRSPAVATAEIAETSSADAVISQGVALSGADGLQRSGHDGSGITIVVLDQAFGAASRLNALAGHRAPADRAPAPADVRRDLRARRARLQRQQLAPRRVRERDRLRHGARGELLVRQLPHARRVRPGRRLHREHDQAEHRRALQLVPVRPLRRHRLVRAEGQPGGCGRHPLGQLGGQLPHPALGGRVERRRRRRQPRRAG